MKNYTINQKEQIVKRIIECRKRKGLKQEEAAKELDKYYKDFMIHKSCSKKSYERYEKASTLPDKIDYILNGLAHIFDVQKEYLNGAKDKFTSKDYQEYREYLSKEENEKIIKKLSLIRYDSKFKDNMSLLVLMLDDYFVYQEYKDDKEKTDYKEDKYYFRKDNSSDSFTLNRLQVEDLIKCYKMTCSNMLELLLSQQKRELEE